MNILKIIKEELGDIMIYTIRLADKLNIDLEKAINEKIKIIVPSNWSKKGFLSFGIPENKIFNNENEDIDFKSFEENIIEKFGLLGQTYLKEKFYEK